MICEEHWKIFDQQQQAWLSQFKLINWESYFEDEMTQEEIEVAELVKRLRDELIAAYPKDEPSADCAKQLDEASDMPESLQQELTEANVEVTGCASRSPS